MAQSMLWEQFKSPMPHCKAFVDLRSNCRVFVGQEPQVGWHLSISHPHRYPTWDEIKAARYDLMPDGVTMAMLLPPQGEYVNIHNNCFHLWEADPQVARVAGRQAVTA